MAVLSARFFKPRNSRLWYNASMAEGYYRQHGGRRYHGYDYSRGAVFFISFGLAGRPHVFGEVSGGKVAYSPAGLAACETLQREATRNPAVSLHSWVIMPDHIHLRLHVRPGTADPTGAIGAFVGNFKRWAAWRAKKLGIVLRWEPNYYDRLCLSREIIEAVDKYIANNPLKWTLMHGANPPLKVVEPLESPLLASDEWWTGVGATAWLDGGRKFAAMKLSRSIAAAEVPAVVARCLGAVERGYTPASTFISPTERALADALAAQGAPMARVVPDALETVYRPKADEPPQFAAGRLLLLSRVAAAGLSRHDAWHGVNDAIAAMAVKSGGTALYVVRERRGAPLEWRFEGGASRPAVARFEEPRRQDDGDATIEEPRRQDGEDARTFVLSAQFFKLRLPIPAGTRSIRRGQRRRAGVARRHQWRRH